MTMNSVIFYFCKFDFNDSFTVLTIIVRKQYILQHQSSQKYGILLNLFDNSCTTFVSAKYSMAIFLIYCVRKLLLVLYVVVLNWYFIIESIIYTHGLHQTVWSGEMTIIRANDA